MGISALFIDRPVAASLLALGTLLAGFIAYWHLPLASLPNVDIPTIVVYGARPGADPENMAIMIAAPLERRLAEIPGVTELTSINATGASTIAVQFDVSRKLDAAAHDVQAAINAAAPDLPSDLPTRPYFRKLNPASLPIMTIALTSDRLPLAQIYDAADSIFAQRLAQVEGVSQVQINGAEKPAVRVRINPTALAAAHLSAEEVHQTIRNNNVLGPVGGFDSAGRAETIGFNGQLSTARDYAPLVVKAANGAVVRLRDLADVVDGVANTKLAADFSGKAAILLTISKSAGANAIETANRVRTMLPQLQTWISPDIQVAVLYDGASMIRASVAEMQTALLITVGLVILVVLLFMRRLVPTIAAGIAVPLSIAGTLAGMWFEGFTLDNYSLMAITISIGFVVDDTIVMVDIIVSYIEQGHGPLRAAHMGARQIGFTVLSISVSLVAVFVPVLFIDGIMGNLLHEFAMTLTIAIVVSAIVSLTLTPMLCARLKTMPQSEARRGRLWRLDRAAQRGFDALLRCYAHTLARALRLRRLMLGVIFSTFVLTVWLYMIVPKGLLPEEDTGMIQGVILTSPDVSFAAARLRQKAVTDVLVRDPAVASVASIVGVTNGMALLNRVRLTIALKPPRERRMRSDAIIARLRPALAAIGGAQTFLWSAQEVRPGSRVGASNQFVLIDRDPDELRSWTARLEDALRRTPGLADVSSDQDAATPRVKLEIDRAAAARLGTSVSAIDDALNNAFAQREISVMYTQRNQYWVVLETDPALQADPTRLDQVFVVAGDGARLPLLSMVRVTRDGAPLSVRHQGQFPATMISYNVAPGFSAGDALANLKRTVATLRLPDTIQTDTAGTTKLFAASLSSLPILIIGAFAAIYLVLGVLYESLTQPLTIISTLFPAGVGALLALLLTGADLSLIAVMAILLLMGIAKKNAIMLIDFALAQERDHGKTPLEAIYAACLERFRPIIMTTLAALFGAAPLAFPLGVGAELRRPLGVALIGGLLVSQTLTLYTTPVVYLALQPRRRERRRVESEGAQLIYSSPAIETGHG